MARVPDFILQLEVRALGVVPLNNPQKERCVCMKEVIILGSGPSAREYSLSGELWATTSVFPELEGLDSNVKLFTFGEPCEAVDIARENNVPIVSTESYHTEPYPYDEILSEFRINYPSPFGCDASYMVAYAVYQGYEMIRLYGVDPVYEWDHITELHSLTFWLGVAKGRGIKPDIARGSRLFRIMREQVKEEYEARAILVGDAKKHYKSFEDIAYEGNDPFCFVSGVDQSAIKVTSSWNYGEVINKWQAET